MTKTMWTLIGTMLTVGAGFTLAGAQQAQPKAGLPQIPAAATKAGLPQLPAAATKAAPGTSAATTKAGLPQVPAGTTKAAPVPAAAPAPAPARGADDAAVRAVIQAYTKAYNEAKPDALTALMTDDVELTDSDGIVTRGRKDVAAQYAAAFAEGQPVTLAAQIETVRFLTADVAQIAGQFRLGDEAALVDSGRFSILAVRQATAWKIAELRDYPMPTVEPESNYEQLKELEWMIGDWVNEGTDAKITSSIKWALNKNYIVRDYSIAFVGEPAMTGMMILGWDAQTQQIKSWVFDSEGGHGVAHWTRLSDSEWILRAQGALRDGRPTSATQVITIVNKDAIKQSSIDRIIGGEVASDINEVLMVRKPAPPASR